MPELHESTEGTHRLQRRNARDAPDWIDHDLELAAAGFLNPVRQPIGLFQIDRRIGALGSARQALESSAHLSSDDRNALEGQIDAAVSGLKALRSTIDADPPARLAADCRAIVTGYRVIGLLVPKVQLAAAADRALGNGDTLTGLAVLLQQRVDAAKGRGKNVAPAQGDVAAIGGKVTEAASAVGGVPAMVLPLDAPGYPANRRTLLAARGSLSAARGALLDALTSAGNASDRLRLVG